MFGEIDNFFFYSSSKGSRGGVHEVFSVVDKRVARACAEEARVSYAIRPIRYSR